MRQRIALLCVVGLGIIVGVSVSQGVPGGREIEFEGERTKGVKLEDMPQRVDRRDLKFRSRKEKAETRVKAGAQNVEADAQQIIRLGTMEGLNQGDVKIVFRDPLHVRPTGFRFGEQTEIVLSLDASKGDVLLIECDVDSENQLESTVTITEERGDDGSTVATGKTWELPFVNAFDFTPVILADGTYRYLMKFSWETNGIRALTACEVTR